METARENITEINKFHTESIKQWTVPDQNIIGEVVHVEPISVNVAKGSPGVGR